MAKKTSRNLDDAWEDLGDAIDRLSTGHKRVGRTNTRANVIRKLKRVRTLLDRDFPTVPKIAKKPRAPRSKRRQWMDFVERMGSIRYTEAKTLRSVRLAFDLGIKVHKSPIKVAFDIGDYIPLWLHAALEKKLGTVAIHKLKKNTNGQRALEAEWRLTSEDDGDVEW